LNFGRSSIGLAAEQYCVKGHPAISCTYKRFRADMPFICPEFGTPPQRMSFPRYLMPAGKVPEH
jgi:hypothetical protein